MTDPEYESFKKMPIENLIARAAGGGIGSTIEKAKFVYGERMMQQQHEYTKQQIDLQHKLNMELMSKQLRWIKFSAFLNALAIIAGVLLGWYLSELKSIQNPIENAQHMIQSQSESSTSASHSETQTDKIPLQPPIKNERRK